MLVMLSVQYINSEILCSHNTHTQQAYNRCNYSGKPTYFLFFPSLPFPSLPFPSRRSRTPSNPVRGMRERCELPQLGPEPQPKWNCLKIMTSGGNNFNYFPENQLTKFKRCPLPTSLFLSPPLRISVTHFASRRVPLNAPANNHEIV